MDILGLMKKILNNPHHSDSDKLAAVRVLVQEQFEYLVERRANVTKTVEKIVLALQTGETVKPPLPLTHAEALEIVQSFMENDINIDYDGEVFYVLG